MHTHWSTNLALYLYTTNQKADQRLAVRAHDESGRIHLGRHVSDDFDSGVHAYAFNVPPEIRRLEFEIIPLIPRRAEFFFKPPPVQRRRLEPH